MDILEMKEKRSALIAECKELNGKENFEEVRSDYESKMAEIKRLTAQIDKENRSNELDGLNKQPEVEVEAREEDNSEEVREAFNAFLKGEYREGEGEGTGAKASGTLLATGSTNGSALVPTEYIENIIKLDQPDVSVLPNVNVITISKKGEIEIPKESADASDCEFTSEITDADTAADSTMAYGKVKITPQRLTKLITVSHQALKEFFTDPAAIVTERLGLKMRQAIEKAILTGTGADGKPLGLLADTGIKTVETASATAITLKDLYKIYYDLPANRRTKAKWVMGTSVLEAVRGMQDANGRPIFDPSGQDGVPRVLGLPVIESDFMGSNTIATGNKVAILGDLSGYSVVQVGSAEIQVLKEKFSLQGLTGFVAEQFVSGKCTDTQAFRILKMK